MKASPTKFPLPDGNFLARGESAIHFYFTESERSRFLPFLSHALQHGGEAVLAAPSAELASLTGELRAPRRRNGNGQLQQVEIAADVAGSLIPLIAAVREAATRSASVRVLVDFAGLVTHEQVFEVEADLSSSFRGLRVTHVTQYDGNAVSATVTLEQFKTHALAVVGDAFYYENRRHISPEAYFRRRATAAATAKG